MIVYFFVSLVTSTIFFAVNLMLMPFAYAKVIHDKIRLAKEGIIST